MFTGQFPRLIQLQREQFESGVRLQEQQLTLAQELQRTRKVTLRQRLAVEERIQTIPVLGQTLLSLQQQQLQSNVIERLLDPSSEFQALDPTVAEGIAANLCSTSARVLRPGETLQNLELAQDAARSQLALDIATPDMPPPPPPVPPTI